MPLVSCTSPASGWSTPASSRSSVDLPAPLGPTTPSTSPGATVTDTPARIVAAPCAFWMSRAINVPLTPKRLVARQSAPDAPVFTA